MVHDRFLLRVGVWSGFAYIVTFGLGWVLFARFFPPVPPTDDTIQVAQRYIDHHVALILGAIAIMGSAVAALPLGALLMLLLRKIECGFGMLTLMTGFVTATLVILTFYTGLSFDLAAFRPDRPPALVQAFDDTGFLQFIGGTPLFLPAWAIIAYAILITQPQTGQQVFPRWVGYVNLLMVLCYLPEGLVFVFHTGPFAWDGVVGFWLPAVLLIIYLTLSPLVLRGAVDRALGE